MSRDANIIWYLSPPRMAISLWDRGNPGIKLAVMQLNKVGFLSSCFFPSETSQIFKLREELVVAIYLGDKTLEHKTI